MVLGLGTDLIEVERIEGALEEHGERFVERVYSRAEIAYCHGRRYPAQSFAARFAAKEACFKALGVGWPKRGVRWRDAEVVRAASGAPSLRLGGALAELASQRGVSRLHLSLSHTAGMALACVVLEGPGPDAPAWTD